MQFGVENWGRGRNLSPATIHSEYGLEWLMRGVDTKRKVRKGGCWVEIVIGWRTIYPKLFGLDDYETSQGILITEKSGLYLFGEPQQTVNVILFIPSTIFNRHLANLLKLLFIVPHGLLSSTSAARVPTNTAPTAAVAILFSSCCSTPPNKLNIHFLLLSI